MHKVDLSWELYPNFTYQIEKNPFWYAYTGLPRFSCENLAMSRTVCVLVAMLNGLKSFALGYGTPKFQSAGICTLEWAVAKGGTADGSLLPERPENAPEYC